MPVSVEFVSTPQLSMMCFSPKVSKEQWSLFTFMPEVKYPVIWYYPLNYTLGDWKYEYGDTLICQFWECDGGKKGCDPSKPDILPNATAGDDLLGQATLSMGSYQILGSTVLNFTVPWNGKGKRGSEAATFLLECTGCRTLWRSDPSWVNPYDQVPSPSPPPPPAASPPPVPSPPVKPDNQAKVPPVDPTTPPPQKSQSPPPQQNPAPPPPTAQAPSVEKFDSSQPQPTLINPKDNGTDLASNSTSQSGTQNILVIVLATLGAIAGVLIAAAITYFGWKRCGWKKVEPEQPPSPKKDENVARHLRIRVQRPADADAAIRQHQVGGAMAELPWAPETRH